MLDRNDIINEAIEKCLEEMFQKSQPKASYYDYVAKVKSGEISKDECIFERHYLNETQFKYIADKYKKAYRLENCWKSDVDFVLSCLKEGGYKTVYKPLIEGGDKVRTAEKMTPIKEIIGEEGFARVLDAMELLGVSFPENFSIYTRRGMWENPVGYKVDPSELYEEDKYIVPFSTEEGLKNKEKDEIVQIGYFEFCKYYQTITFGINGYVYSWTRRSPIDEEMTISKDHINNYSNQLSVSIRDLDDGIQSSILRIKGKHDIPELKSYIDNVKVYKYYYNDWGKDEVFEIDRPISEYKEAFSQLINEERFQCLIPDELRKPEFYALLQRMMEEPINIVIYNMTYTDQSWRFDQERKAIENDCTREKNKAQDEYDREIERIDRLRKGAESSADKKRKEKLSRVDELEKAYKAQMALKPIGE